MAKVLEEYFPEVMSCDIADYGQDRIADFLSKDVNEEYDFIITNPPFNLAEEFVLKALPLAKESTAIFARTQFIESVGRYERLFKQTRQQLLLNLQSAYQLSKDVCQQMLQRLQAMLGSSGKALKDGFKI